MKKSKFTFKDLAMFKRFRIPSALVEAAQISRVTDIEARKLGIRGRKTQDMSGLAFVYIDPSTGKPTNVRVRRDNPEIKNGKVEGKYMSPSDVKTRGLYFPPNCKGQLENREIPLALVESEKATLALAAWSDRVQNSLIAIAMGGCWGWMKNNGAGKKSTPLADLDVCKGHLVYVLLDSNVETNAAVQSARNALVKELLDRHCDVLIATLPTLEGINGPDDLIASPDGDKLMQTVLKNAVAPAIAPYSEDALALRFTEQQGENWRYVTAWERWMHWDGNVWRHDETAKINDEIRKVCRDAANESLHRTTAVRIGKAGTVRAVEMLMRTDPRHATPVDQWDANPMLINTPSGVYNLVTGECMPAKREFYCTKITKGSRKGSLRRWKKFLNDFTGGDKAYQKYLQVLCGYLLTGLTKEHKVHFCYGTGANGKSVFINTFSGMLGEYACPAPIEMFTVTRNERHPTDLASLHGARLVTVTETEAGSRWDETKIKLLTGGDRIAARFMHQNYWYFTPQFKLLISGNNQPALRSVDFAMKRRMVVLPFEITFQAEEQDLDLATKLQEDWSAILLWAIEGCLEWQRLGLKMPPAIMRATGEYMEEQDTVGRWIADRIVEDPNAKTSPTDLFEDFRRWADRKRVRYCGIAEFSQNLAGRDFQRIKSGGSRFFRGLRVKTGQDGADLPVIPHNNGRDPHKVVTMTGRGAPTRPGRPIYKYHPRRSNNS
jgi:P4 family phage/plasmid primase-like protien